MGRGENHRVHDVTPCTGESCKLYWGRSHAKQTVSINARRLVPDSDSRDCFWLCSFRILLWQPVLSRILRHRARRRGTRRGAAAVTPVMTTQALLVEWNTNLYLYSQKLSGIQTLTDMHTGAQKMPKKDVISTKPVKKQWSPRGPQEKKKKEKEKKRKRKIYVYRTPSLRSDPR